MRTVRLELDLDLPERVDSDDLLGRVCNHLRSWHEVTVRSAAISTTAIEGPASNDCNPDY